MAYEDSYVVSTPEGLDLTFALAGLGTRFVGLALDIAIQLVVFVGLVALSTLLPGETSGAIIAAVVAVLAFVVLFGYWVAFETLDGGRSPGKRVVRTRVANRSGAAITFRQSAVRNLLRVVDFLPSAYLVGAVGIVVTRTNQRVGDVAAGTIVVREPPAAGRRRRRRSPSPPMPVAVHDPRELLGWDVSGVSADQVATVRAFLGRRPDLTLEARHRLAGELARALRPLVRTTAAEPDDERFLEKLDRAKAERQSWER
jgi:uncharacterized RDD family membrane protein YckC